MAGTGRDLALAAPSCDTPKGVSAGLRQQVDRIVIPERVTRWVTALYVRLPPIKASRSDRVP
jgi:hypothetical protein